MLEGVTVAEANALAHRPAAAETAASVATGAAVVPTAFAWSPARTRPVRLSLARVSGFDHHIIRLQSRDERPTCS